MNCGYCLSTSCNLYKMPEANNMNDYQECISKMPTEMCPEHMGLACNAQKMNNVHCMREMMNSLWLMREVKMNNCEKKRIMKMINCI